MAAGGSGDAAGVRHRGHVARRVAHDSLVAGIAAAAADGVTTLRGTHHLDRGYHRPLENFAGLGLDILSTGAFKDNAAINDIVTALSGASSRAPAHLGAVRALADHQLPIDIISGSSSGGFSSFCTSNPGACK